VVMSSVAMAWVGAATPYEGACGVAPYSIDAE